LSKRDHNVLQTEAKIYFAGLTIPIKRTNNYSKENCCNAIWVLILSGMIMTNLPTSTSLNLLKQQFLSPLTGFFQGLSTSGERHNAQRTIFYCEIIFIRWTFDFVFLVGWQSTNLRSQQNIFHLSYIVHKSKSMNSSFQKDVYHCQTTKFRSHEI